MVDNIGERLIKAIVYGLIAGFVTALLLFVLSAILPGVVINASFWGMIVGILAGLYAFFVGRRTV